MENYVRFKKKEKLGSVWNSKDPNHNEQSGPDPQYCLQEQRSVRKKYKKEKWEKFLFKGKEHCIFCEQFGNQQPVWALLAKKKNHWAR